MRGSGKLRGMKTILVTGGAGFIGSNFVHYTRSHFPAMHIIVLDALTYAGNLANLRGLIEEPGGENTQSSNVEFVHASINNKEAVEQVMSRADLAVHFAAESHNDRAIASPDIFFETNVMGTLTLLKSAARHAVRFHHISTDEVYGDLELDSNEKFSEESPYRPSSPYAASKAASDHLVRAWTRTYGLRSTISNCSNNYGPYQHIEKFIPRAITNALSGLPIKLYGDGRAVRDWIHVEDQCAAIWQIVQSGKVGSTYNIGSDCAVSNRDVARMLSDVLFQETGVAPKIEFVCDRPGADKRYALDTSCIRTELGWKPTHSDFVQGLTQTVQWYAHNRQWWSANKLEVEKDYAKTGQ